MADDILTPIEPTVTPEEFSKVFFPDFDAFTLQLLDYIYKNHLHIPIDHSVIEQRAQTAASAWELARVSGLSIDQADEVANDALLSGLGVSEFDAVDDILYDTFYPQFGDDYSLWAEAWIPRCLEEVDNLFDGIATTPFGLDEDDVTAHRSDILSKLTVYLSSENAI